MERTACCILLYNVQMGSRNRFMVAIVSGSSVRNRLVLYQKATWLVSLSLVCNTCSCLNMGTFISIIIMETSVSMLFKDGPATLVMIAYVLLSLFFLTIIIMLCNKNMRAVYGIDNRIMIGVLIITTLVACLELSQHVFFLTL